MYSTISSSLSGAAANCWDDVLKLKLSWITEVRKALINRLLGTFTDKINAALFLGTVKLMRMMETVLERRQTVVFVARSSPYNYFIRAVVSAISAFLTLGTHGFYRAILRSVI